MGGERRWSTLRREAICFLESSPIGYQPQLSVPIKTVHRAPQLTVRAFETACSQPGVAPTREAANLLVALVSSNIRTLAFVRTRRVAELVYMYARDMLDDMEPPLGNKISPYRASYLAEDRRAIERALFNGDLIGVAATNALELGIDVGDTGCHHHYRLSRKHQQHMATGGKERTAGRRILIGVHRPG